MENSSTSTPLDSTWHWLSPERGSLLENLPAALDLPPSRVADLLSLGAIFLNRKRVQEDSPLEPGDYVRVHRTPRRFRLPEGEMADYLVAETSDFWIVNKPAGLPVHASLDNARENILAWLQNAVQEKVYVTQRLDIPTCGLLVLAKSPGFQSRFNRWLSERRIEKYYRALVARPVPLGRLVHYQRPDPRAPKEVSREAIPGWRRCELVVLDCVSHGDAFALDLRLETGRTHQIRCQLADYGATILGDTLYQAGTSHPEHPQRIALQAYGLSFEGGSWRLEPPPAWSSEHFPLSPAASSLIFKALP